MPLRIPPLVSEKAWGVEDFGFTADGVQAVNTTPIKWWSEYDKSTEFGSPGRYAVGLMGPNATAEMLAISQFAGYHRYSFSPSSSADEPKESNGVFGVRTPQPALSIDVCHAGAEKADPREPNFCINASIGIGSNGRSFDAWVHYRGSLSGDVMPVYLHGSLPSGSAAVSSWTVCDKDERCRTLGPGESASSASGVLFALAHLPRATKDVVTADVLVGISFQSANLAKLNLQAALDTVGGSTSFDDLAQETETQWCSALSAMHVTSDPSDPDLPVLLHSAHYRTLMSPTVKEVLSHRKPSRYACDAHCILLHVLVL